MLGAQRPRAGLGFGSSSSWGRGEERGGGASRRASAKRRVAPYDGSWSDWSGDGAEREARGGVARHDDDVASYVGEHRRQRTGKWSGVDVPVWQIP